MTHTPTQAPKVLDIYSTWEMIQHSQTEPHEAGLATHPGPQTQEPVPGAYSRPLEDSSKTNNNEACSMLLTALEGRKRSEGGGKDGRYVSALGVQREGGGLVSTGRK